MKKYIALTALVVALVSQNAMAFNTISCSNQNIAELSLAQADQIRQQYGQDIFTSAYTLSPASFTISESGTLNGVTRYQIDDSSYKTLALDYVLTVDGLILKFHSDSAFSTNFKNRNIVLDAPDAKTGKTYLFQTGRGEYGGGFFEVYKALSCRIQ